MAVSLDVGNESDVHPKKKWIVGERLSKVALAKTYKKSIPFSGPLFDFVNIINNKLEVHFLYGDGLKTINEGPIKDIQIAGADKLFVKAEAKIIGNKLEVWSSEIENPRYIKYGYTPFTEANLLNKHNLPASTFSNLIE